MYNMRERSLYIEHLFTLALVIRGRYLPDLEFWCDSIQLRWTWNSLQSLK